MGRDGFRYSKAGIVMDDLIPAGCGPRPLFDARDRDQSDRLMTAIDAVNAKFGRRHPARLADQIRHAIPALHDARG